MSNRHEDYKQYKREQASVDKWWVARTEDERVTLIFNIIKVMNDTVAAEIVERHHKSTRQHPDGQTFNEIAQALHLPPTTVKRKYHDALKRIKTIAKSREVKDD